MIRALPIRRLAASLLAWSALATAQPEATAKARVAAPAVLEWKATKEDGVYGYLVYRATDREGPFRRLGSEIVHVSLEPGEIHSYRVEDPTVEPGRTYYYYLDKIATTGEKSRFSGVVTKIVPTT